MADKKATADSTLVNRETEMLDKYPRRVIVFLVVMCFITLGITPALAFLPTKDLYVSILISVLYIVLAILEIALIFLLMKFERIRRRFPANFFLTMLHAACLSVLTEAMMIGKDYRWVLGVMALAVVLYIMCISIGASVRSELRVGSLGMLIGYIAFSLAVGAATIAVFYSGDHATWSLLILAVGTTILVIPVALFFGQITLGQIQFREFGRDYCFASIAAHAVLLIFLITLSIGLKCPTKTRQTTEREPTGSFTQ
nr:unnamed protein product [Trichobilharzia regenti]